MDGKKLLFIGFMTDTWQEIINYLRQGEAKDSEYLKHMEEVLKGGKK